MGASELLQIAGQFGFGGFFVAYLIWAEQRRDRQRAAERAERIKLDEADIQAREKLASSLTALSMVIQGRPNV